MPWNPEHYMKTKEVIKILEYNKITNVTKQEPKIIHTKTFSCANDHPIVWYTFDNKIDSTDKTDKGYVVCEYCYDKFIYEKKTYSEEMQDKIEPINDYNNWWGRHKGYIEHRKKYPYGKPPKIKDE